MKQLLTVLDSFFIFARFFGGFRFHTRKYAAVRT